MLKVEKNEGYSFDEFLKKRAQLNDLDNPFLLQVLKELAGDGYGKLIAALKPFSKKVAYRWRPLISEYARPENHPKIRHFDAFNHRIDRIIQPQEAVQVTKEVFQEALFSVKNLPYEGICKRYLLQSNGEAAISCPLVCTDGLIALIEAYYDEVPDAVREIHRHAKEGINGDFAIGAQFMTEMQGGSDIPANVLNAVPDGNVYRLYGHKYFCSAVHADYAVVTARIEDTDDIAVFIVPSWLPENKKKEIRNHYEINRLKWKLGTCELPSGEIEYKGAIAYRIGPQDCGVAIAVSIVLTRSRLDIGFASGAFMMRAAREAKLYASFREVFDRKIDQFPMAAAQLADLEYAAKRTVATAFHIYKKFANPSGDPLDNFALRELILLQKIYTSKEAVENLRLAISLFGGNGAIEDFNDIARLFRDSIVNELWEGPRNVLLSQIYRDLQKSKWPLTIVLQEMFPHLSIKEIRRYAEEISSIMQINLVDLPNKDNMRAARRWEALWEELFVSYQEFITKRFEHLPIL
ncbi:acyl-CoA dehydrogenase family protein [Ureibacillus thermophilus]|uniref:Acyl-CoA dehydrogenase n=1 Tax=Ureibacillus thermophilus TaxID=367743 RepID=A0A4P6UVV3_9BACL|nr:acyl-CoA dehydrogenase family protein [Ureibacillus thermophilus]QBK26326.1 acyl-CoA dehydrogenase [Ureibacillus thermophilus]